VIADWNADTISRVSLMVRGFSLPTSRIASSV